MKAGHAIWVNKSEIRLDVMMGADIARFTEEYAASVRAATARRIRRGLFLGTLTLLAGLAYFFHFLIYVALAVGAIAVVVSASKGSAARKAARKAARNARVEKAANWHHMRARDKRRRVIGATDYLDWANRRGKYGGDTTP